MQLELILSPQWNASEAGLDLAAADESALRYGAFLGDISLQIGDIDFSAKWGWIPLLDFAYCLKSMSDEMLAGEPETVFEFTESDAVLRLTRDGQNVLVAASYVGTAARVDLLAFCDMAISVSRRFFESAAAETVGLASNPSFESLWQKVRGPSMPSPRPIGTTVAGGEVAL
jgi:hypothetical protein